MQTAISLKQEGNQLYVKGKVEEAIAQYKAAAEAALAAFAVTSSSAASAPAATPIVADELVASLADGGKSFPPLNRFTVASTSADVATYTLTKKEEGASAEEVAAAAKELGIIFSNASQALLDLKRHDAAAAAAANAVSFDPSSVKGWSRRIRALSAVGSRFEAFILYFVSLAPLLKKGSRAEQQEAMKIVMDLGDEVSEAVGVTAVHAGLALRRTVHYTPRLANSGKTMAASNEASKQKEEEASSSTDALDGGLSTYATVPITADSVIFSEKQFTHAKLSASAPPNALTTESLVLFFSDQLMAAVRSPQREEGKLLWATIASAMRGSWPRRLGEIGAELSEKFTEELRRHHRKDIADGFIIDESSSSSSSAATPASDAAAASNSSPLTTTSSSTFRVTLAELAHMAVACRYNCFHSGFFRACALANHSCSPNAAMKYVPAQQKVVMVAVRDIAVGEAITVKYLPDMEYILGVSRRRELLYRSWLFWCDCRRCDDDLFDAEGSRHEWVRCPSCNPTGSLDRANGAPPNPKGYAHLPLPAVDMDEKDPSIANESPCFSCGAMVSISRDDTVALLSTVEGLLSTIQTPHMSLSIACEALLRAWRVAASTVHEDHWTHRSQLYCFCLALGEPIRNTFGYIASSPPGMVRPETSLDLLVAFGLAEGRPNPLTVEAAPGGDLLVGLVELWRRIEPFYPPSQAYHLHMMVSQLICLNLMLPERLMARRGAQGARYLDPEVAAAMLARHAPFIGQQDRTGLWRVVSQRRDADRTITWSPKALKAIKKALS